MDLNVTHFAAYTHVSHHLAFLGYLCMDLHYCMQPNHLLCPHCADVCLSPLCTLQPSLGVGGSLLQCPTVVCCRGSASWAMIVLEERHPHVVDRCACGIVWAQCKQHSVAMEVKRAPRREAPDETRLGSRTCDRATSARPEVLRPNIRHLTSVHLQYKRGISSTPATVPARSLRQSACTSRAPPSAACASSSRMSPTSPSTPPGKWARRPRRTRRRTRHL